MHVIACVSVNGLAYWERRVAAFRWKDANDYVRRLLLSLKEQALLDEVVLVLDNAPCHTHVEEVFRESEFECATLLCLGPYLPMLNPIENVFSTYKSAVKRFK
jgi:transposase